MLLLEIQFIRGELFVIYNVSEGAASYCRSPVRQNRRQKRFNGGDLRLCRGP